MAALTSLLYLFLGLLIVDSVLEMAFITNMVNWVNNSVWQGFTFTYSGLSYPLAGEPANFSVNQGHTSNGAAGTALILIGLGGLLALWLRSRAVRHAHISPAGLPASIWIYYIWVLASVPALLLTTAAFIYVFAVTYGSNHGSSIDPAIAASLNGAPYVDDPNTVWVPQNWFAAVAQLDSLNSLSDVQNHLTTIRGWQWNLIPLLLIQITVTTLGLLDFRRFSMENRTFKASSV